MGFANGDTGARMIGAMLKAKGASRFYKANTSRAMENADQNYGKEFE
jgi:hypothetical protein